MFETLKRQQYRKNGIFTIKNNIFKVVKKIVEDFYKAIAIETTFCTNFWTS